MRKNLLSVYKLPLLISTVLAIAFIAMKTARYPLDIGLLVIGSYLGVVVLDLEYIIYAYVLEPEEDFSKTLVGFIKHKDYMNALSFIHYNKGEIKEKSLNSAIFQVVLAPVSILVIYATPSVFVKALVLSIFANTIYRLAESYYEGKTDEWFWTFKKKPDKSGVIVYTFVLLCILAFCLINFR